MSLSIQSGASPPPSPRAHESSDDIAQNTSAEHPRTKVKPLHRKMFTFVVWIKENAKPIRLSIVDDNPMYRALPLFIDLPEDDTLHVWIPSDKIWVQSSPRLLPFHIDSSARSVLVRYPVANDCKNFPRVLRMLDDERHEDPGPGEWEYTDLRAEFPRPHYGFQFTVVAYGEHDAPPVIFFVTLTKERELRWRLHPRLLQHVMGTSSTEFPLTFHCWCPLTHSWSPLHPDNPFTMYDGYDFAVVRHKANPSAPGLAHFAGLLDKQSQDPVILFAMVAILTNSHPRNGQFPPTGRTKTLWPVMLPIYVPVERTVSTLHPCATRRSVRHAASSRLDRDSSTTIAGSSASATKRKGDSESLSDSEVKPEVTPLRRSTRKPKPKIMNDASSVSLHGGAAYAKKAKRKPNRPAGARVFGLDDPGQNLKYSKELKTACLLAAGPQPDPPSLCPRCGQKTAFDSRICYKYGIAAAWNMWCHGCRQVHIPTQQGPSEHALHGIETIRERDIQAHAARKEKQARIRAEKKAVKDKKTRDRLQRSAATETVGGGSTSGKERATFPQDVVRVKSEHARPHGERPKDRENIQRPFSVIGNAPISNVLDPLRRVKDHGKRVDRPIEIISDDEPTTFDPEVRTVIIVLWEKPDQPPFIDRVEVPLHEKLYLYHNPRVRAIPPPTEFERWVFLGNVWSPIPWDVSPLELRPDDAIVFVRVAGIRCIDFGSRLHTYQVEHGHALSSKRSLQSQLYEPPLRHRWIIVWTKDEEPPDIFLVSGALFDDVQHGDEMAMPWLDLLRDAPFFVIWHETHTRWAGVLRNQSPHVPDDAPIILIAHPGVSTRIGSGEAISWFESWRAAHPQRRSDSPDLHFSRAPLKRSIRDSPEETTAKKRSCHKSEMAGTQGAISASKDTGPHSNLLSPGPGALDNGQAVSRVTQDTSNQRRASLTGSHWAFSHLGESLSNPLTISDDEPEFIEGSSKSPVKGRRQDNALVSKPLKAPEFDRNGDLIIDLTDA